MGTDTRGPVYFVESTPPNSMVPEGASAVQKVVSSSSNAFVFEIILIRAN